MKKHFSVIRADQDQEQNHHLVLLHALGLEGLPLHCRKVAKKHTMAYAMNPLE